MAITKIITNSIADTAISTAKIADDAIDDTKLDLTDDYAFTGTITGVSSGVGTVSAWVSFNSMNTPSIISSGNVSSITDIAQGQYDVNFTNAFSNTNYCTVTGGGGEIRNNTLTNVALPDNKRTTSKIGVDTQYNHQNVFEPPYVNLLVIT